MHVYGGILECYETSFVSLGSMWDGLENATVANSFYQTASSEIVAAAAYATRALLEDDGDIEEYGHQKTDMITSCVFSGYQCSPA